MTRAASIPPVDQAARLRALVSSLRTVGSASPAGREAPPPAWACPFIVVASGKGGVGKSCLSILLAGACARAGERVLLADADLGAANLDVLLRLTPRRRIDALWNGADHAIAIPAPAGDGHSFGLIAGLSGGASPGADERRRMIASLARLGAGADLVFADAGAGLGPGVLELAHAAHLAVIVVTPDPASITDAYALFKTIAPRAPDRVGVIVNQARTDAEGVEIHRRMALAGERFVGARPALLGVMTEEPSIRHAARTQSLAAPGVLEEGARSRALACSAEVTRLARLAFAAPRTSE